MLVRSAEELKLGTARRGPLHNSHSRKLLQIIKCHFMTALLNFVGGTSSKLDMTMGGLQ